MSFIYYNSMNELNQIRTTTNRDYLDLITLLRFTFNNNNFTLFYSNNWRVLKRKILKLAKDQGRYAGALTYQ